MQGRGVNVCNFIKEQVEGIDIEAVTAEAYADDLTVIFKMMDGSLETVIGILEEYGRSSGLEINKKKTQLMVTGVDNYEVGGRAAAHIGDIGVVTWHDFTWRGQGYIFLLPPTPQLGRALTSASFCLRVTRCWCRATH